MKTWSGGKLDDKISSEKKKLIEEFLAGEDILLDKKLVKWEILSTISHQIMLNRIGVLTGDELKQILKELVAMYEQGIQLKQELEDVHGNVEGTLIEKLGDVGKKVHTATSRNEKAMVDIKLYAKDELLQISTLALQLARTITDLAKKHKDSPMPGYTHHQQAMPYTFGSFLMSHAHSLLADTELLHLVYKTIDKNPLGTGAGYGIPLDIDRKLTTKLLGFTTPQENSLSTISSRGKDESLVAYVCNQIMLDLGKLAQDLILFSMKEFNFVELPNEYCTGSSIMPQKKNPDVLELLKGKCAKASANLFQIITAMKNLPSGYNRDLQETKGPFMDSIETTKQCLTVMDGLIGKMKVNEDEMKNKMGNETFSTHYALSLVNQGVPYKEAYKTVGDKLKRGEQIPEAEVKPDFGENYKELLQSSGTELKKMKTKFGNEIESLISLAKKISNKQ